MGKAIMNGAASGSIGETRVSVFRNVMSNGSKDMSVEERCKVYSGSRGEPQEMSLREVLELGEKYRDVIERLRSCEY